MNDRPEDTASPLSRRAVLMAATGAGLAVGTPVLAAKTAPSGFGAPLVEVSVPTGALSAEQKAEMIQGINDVILGAMRQPPDPSRRLFVEIFETADSGFGVNGHVFVPRAQR
jgi:phenylpyruvate tautomerase PptA (4-oxalocrotonate tautomerase family)